MLGQQPEGSSVKTRQRSASERWCFQVSSDNDERESLPVQELPVQASDKDTKSVRGSSEPPLFMESPFPSRRASGSFSKGEPAEEKPGTFSVEKVISQESEVGSTTPWHQCWNPVSKQCTALIDQLGNDMGLLRASVMFASGLLRELLTARAGGCSINAHRAAGNTASRGAYRAFKTCCCEPQMRPML